MRCDEIQERILEFVYDEGADAPENADLREHLRTCPACREELEQLRQTRKYLQLWKDEPPLQSVATGRHGALNRRSAGLRYWRYAAIAAMVVIGLLALGNTRITWNKNGFSFSARLFPWQDSGRDTYTKAEVRNLMKRALDDSELRMNETNYMMMQKLLETVEQDHWMDTRLVRGHASNRNEN